MTEAAPHRRALIVNPMAGSAERVRELLAALEGRAGWTVWLTQAPGHATDLARRALEEGFDDLVVAGGDGTIHEAVNGLASRWDQLCLGVLPVGTGNDLARTLGVPAELFEALEIIEQGVERRLDLIQVQMRDGERHWAVNTANGGNARLTDQVVDDGLKQRWGPLAYLAAGFQVVDELETYQVTLGWSDGEVSTAEIFGVVIANGRTLGGGIPIAPHADPADGELDVILVEAVPAARLAFESTRLAIGDVTQNEGVCWRRTASLEIVDAEPELWFNLDGEVYGEGIANLEVLPEALRIHGLG